jgi:hypothetical protein
METFFSPDVPIYEHKPYENKTQGRPYPKADKARALGLSFLRPFWLKFRPHIYIYIKY